MRNNLPFCFFEDHETKLFPTRIQKSNYILAIIQVSGPINIIESNILLSLTLIFNYNIYANNSFIITIATISTNNIYYLNSNSIILLFLIVIKFCKCFTRAFVLILMHHNILFSLSIKKTLF